MAESLKEIQATIKAHKKELYSKYHVKKMGVFGSYVRGEQKKRSDIDILVEFEELPSLLGIIDMELYLRKLLRKKVDLIEKTGLRPELKDIVLNEVVYL